MRDVTWPISVDGPLLDGCRLLQRSATQKSMSPLGRVAGAKRSRVLTRPLCDHCLRLDQQARD